jgi:hypothetical protein
MPKRSDIIDIVMTETTLQLSDRLVSLLGATPGSGIVIEFMEKDGTLVPVIAIGEEGNKLTRTNTVSYRGKKHNVLTEFGSNFWAHVNNGIIELEGDRLPVYTSVQKATESYLTAEIITDTNYNITKLNNYEF